MQPGVLWYSTAMDPIGTEHLITVSVLSSGVEIHLGILCFPLLELAIPRKLLRGAYAHGKGLQMCEVK